MRRPWPFRHFGLKLLSIGFAIVLWMVVSGEETVERGLRVPLELQQAPAGIELTGDVPTTVDVRVRGGSGVLSRVSAGEVVAVLDLRTAGPGRRLFPLTPKQVRVPFGVEVMLVTPPAIAMAFETTSTRKVPVAPAVDGRPAPGYVVGPMTSEPASVEIIGPESAVKRATEALTEPVSVDGARERVRASVNVGMLDPSLRLKNPRPAIVTVQILPAPLERRFGNRPVRLRNVAPLLQAEASPTVVDVTLRGSRDALNHVDPDDVDVHVDLSGLGSGEYMLTARADVSQDVGVVRIEPSTVKVRISSGKR